MDDLKLERMAGDTTILNTFVELVQIRKRKFGQKKLEVLKVREGSQVQKYKLGTDGEEKYQREWSGAGALIGSVGVKYLT